MKLFIIAVSCIMVISSSAYSETYTNNQSNEEIKKSLYDQSAECSKQLSVKLDEYIQFLLNNPATNNVETKYNEIESLFSTLGDICKKMEDVEHSNMRGVKALVYAAEIEKCNGSRYVLAPFVANAIVKTAKYYANKGDKVTAKRMYRDVIVRFTGLKYQSQVKEAEFGLEDLTL